MSKYCLFIKNTTCSNKILFGNSKTIHHERIDEYRLAICGDEVKKIFKTSFMQDLTLNSYAFLEHKQAVWYSKCRVCAKWYPTSYQPLNAVAIRSLFHLNLISTTTTRYLTSYAKANDFPCSDSSPVHRMQYSIFIR